VRTRGVKNRRRERLNIKEIEDYIAVDLGVASELDLKVIATLLVEVKQEIEIDVEEEIISIEDNPDFKLS
jgi:hypothetical protein